MSYLVQKGDTIAKVTELLKTPWEGLRRLNPDAVGRTASGRWFLKEGAVVQGNDSFRTELERVQTPDRSTPDPALPKEDEKWIEYTIKKGDTLWGLAVKRFHVNVEDLIEDNDIEDPRRLMPGQKIRVRLPSYPQKQTVVASWYGKAHHGKLMANGKPFNMHGATVAHRDIPLGTRVILENPVTGQKAKAVVTDRGPYIDGRDLDLSYGLAKKLSLIEQGVGRLIMRVLG
jgi:rare lipoprotein A